MLGMELSDGVTEGVSVGNVDGAMLGIEVSD